jgi:hypothetical protein
MRSVSDMEVRCGNNTDCESEPSVVGYKSVIRKDTDFTMSGVFATLITTQKSHT